MLGKIFEVLHSDTFLKLAGVAVALAIIGKNTLPPNTVLYSVCTHVIEIGAFLGVSSTVSREPKAVGVSP